MLHPLPMDSSSQVHDVIVVGAGLAGLTAALRLAREGREVLVVERRAQAGGLCGIYTRDGYEFVIGCNDFGTGMVKHMAELGVPVRFVHRRTRFVLAKETYHVPPTPGTFLLALKHAPDIVRLVRAMGAKDGAPRYAYLGEVVEHAIKDSAFADFIASLSYAVGLAPSAFPLEDLKAALSKDLGYGYDKVVTGQGTFSARHVITSQGRWDQYPAEARPSLAVSTLHLAVKRSFAFPEGLHPLTCFPANVAGWLGQLDRGELPRELGFHCFPTPELPHAAYWARRKSSNEVSDSGKSRSTTRSAPMRRRASSTASSSSTSAARQSRLRSRYRCSPSVSSEPMLRW
jgi:hypothetical protein